MTRWVDRLLPFDFEIEHAPGRTMGLADYLSRNPSNQKGENVKAESLWNNWFTVNVVKEMNDVLATNRKKARKFKPIRSEEPSEWKRKASVTRSSSSGRPSGENNTSSGVNQIDDISEETCIGNSNLKRIAASLNENKPSVNRSVYSVSGEKKMNLYWADASDESETEGTPVAKLSEATRRLRLQWEKDQPKVQKQPVIGLINDTLLAANYAADKELQGIIRMIKEGAEPRKLGQNGDQ